MSYFVLKCYAPLLGYIVVDNVDQGFGSSPVSTKATNLPSSQEVKRILATKDRKKIKALLRSNDWPLDHEVFKHSLHMY